ncbi:MAG: hypothetical protein ACFE0J_09235 [Elainellaceae cyanobacterium]
MVYQNRYPYPINCETPYSFESKSTKKASSHDHGDERDQQDPEQSSHHTD